MLRNVKKTEFGFEGKVFFKLFNKEILFNVIDEDNLNIDYIEKCSKYLNAINDNVVDHLCESSVRYCNNILYYAGEELKYFSNIRDILSIIYPSCLVIPTPNANYEPIIQLELGCEWEEEHGMEWIVRNNNVLYVGGCIGAGPWDDYTIKKSWNYA